MNQTPSFQLEQPAALAWDAHQHALFTANGQPRPSITATERARKQVTDFLAAARVPVVHRAAFANHLCENVPIDPEGALWLGIERHWRRWEMLLSIIDSGTHDAAATCTHRRALWLVSYARRLGHWPPCAIHALHQQRVGCGAFDMATFAPLPTRIRDHRGALLMVAMEARAMLYAALAQPTRNRCEGDVVTVEVLGCFQLVFDFAQRNVCVQVIDQSDFVPTRADADLLEPLPAGRWCPTFVVRLQQTLRVALGAAWNDDAIRAAATTWLADTVHRLAERSHALEHVRAQIRQAYPHDRQIVHDLRACTIDLGLRQGVSTREYVWAWRNAAVLRQRVAGSAQLAAVWLLLVRRRVLRVDDDYDVLKAVMRDEGVTAFGWKLLCRYSHALYRPLIGALHPDSAMVAFGTYLRLLQRVQYPKPMPYVLVRAMFSPHWFAHHLEVHKLPLGLIRGAIERLGSALPLGGQEAFIEHEFVPVLGWFARAKPVLDANQQRASWPWFLARYRNWSEHERLTREGQYWMHGIDDLRWRRFDVVPIRDSATLWTEGELMRSCLSSYAGTCAAGRYLVYSVRAGNHRHPVAHIGLDIDNAGQATLDQAHGFANAPVEPALEEFAARLAKRTGHLAETKTGSE